MLSWLLDWLHSITAGVRPKAARPRHRLTDDVPVAEQVDIHYKFVFDIGRSVDPLEGAQRILSSDISRSAVATSSGDVFDATRLQALKRQVRIARQFLDAAADLSSRGGLATLAYLLRHPSIPIRVLAFRRRRRRDDDHGSASDQRDGNLSLDDIEQAVVAEPFLVALQHHVDRQLFRPDYLASDPWVRVELQPCFLTSTTGEQFAVDVVLVLHRTGTAVLTFYVRHDRPLETGSLIERSVASQASTVETELATAIVEAAAAALGVPAVAPVSHRFSSGVRWSKWSHADTVSLSEVFEMYADALRAVLNAKDPARPKRGDDRSFTAEWHAYPVVCIHKPSPDLRVGGALALQLGAIIGRIADWRDVESDYLTALVQEDWSNTRDRSYWFTGASATLVHSTKTFDGLAARFSGPDNVPGQEWIIRDQAYAAVFDLLLIQYHTALAINRQIEIVKLSAIDVEAVKARMLVARTDLAGESLFSYSDLRDIEQYFHAIRGIPAYWTHAEDKFRLVDDVLASRESERRFRSERALQAVIGAVAIAVGIPAISELVQRVANVNDVAPSAYLGLGRVVNWASEAAESSSGPITVGSVAALIVLLLAVLWRGRRSRPERTRLTERGQGTPPRRPLYQYFPGQRIVIGRTSDGATITASAPDDGFDLGEDVHLG